MQEFVTLVDEFRTVLQWIFAVLFVMGLFVLAVGSIWLQVEKAKMRAKLNPSHDVDGHFSHPTITASSAVSPSISRERTTSCTAHSSDAINASVPSVTVRGKC